MTPDELALFVAVYAAVLGSDVQRDHDAAYREATKAVARLRKK